MKKLLTNYIVVISIFIFSDCATKKGSRVLRKRNNVKITGL